MPKKPVLPPGPGKPGSKTEKHLLSADDCPGGLVGRHYQHLRHLYMFGYGSGKVHHFGNVVTGKRTDTLVHIVGSGFVSTKAHYGEIRLHKAGLDVRHPDGSIHEVDAQAVGQGFDGSFCGTIHTTSRIA